MNYKDYKPKDEKVSDKYSSNLYKFLKKYKDKYSRVYFKPTSNYDGNKIELDSNKCLPFGQIYLGHVADSDIIGKSLAGIITGQKNYTVGCYLNAKNEWIDITEEFWTRYKDIGRCLFIGHDDWYQDDYNTRFTYLDDKTRKCNWCGKIQYKRIEEIVREKEIWEG